MEKESYNCSTSSMRNEGASAHSSAMACGKRLMMAFVLGCIAVVGVYVFIPMMASDIYAERMHRLGQAGDHMLIIVKSLDSMAVNGSSVPCSIHEIRRLGYDVSDPYHPVESLYFSTLVDASGRVEWVLASVGPDQIPQYPYRSLAIVDICQFDAMNGSASTGDIIFTSSKTPVLCRQKRY